MALHKPEFAGASEPLEARHERGIRCLRVRRRQRHRHVVAAGIHAAQALQRLHFQPAIARGLIVRRQLQQHLPALARRREIAPRGGQPRVFQQQPPHRRIGRLQDPADQRLRTIRLAGAHPGGGQPLNQRQVCRKTLVRGLPPPRRLGPVAALFSRPRIARCHHLVARKLRQYGIETRVGGGKIRLLHQRVQRLDIGGHSFRQLAGEAGPAVRGGKGRTHADPIGCPPLHPQPALVDDGRRPGAAPGPKLGPLPQTPWRSQ